VHKKKDEQFVLEHAINLQHDVRKNTRVCVQFYAD
jgi:hypothetical protein